MVVEHKFWAILNFNHITQVLDFPKVANVPFTWRQNSGLDGCERELGGTGEDLCGVHMDFSNHTRGETSWLGRISELLEMSLEYARIMHAQRHSHSMSRVSVMCSVWILHVNNVTKGVAPQVAENNFLSRQAPSPASTKNCGQLQHLKIHLLLPADQSQLAAALAALGSCEAFWSSAAGGWLASLGKPLLWSRVWFTGLHSRAGQQAHLFFACWLILPAVVWGKVLSNSESGANLSGGDEKAWPKVGGTNSPSGVFSDFWKPWLEWNSWSVTAVFETFGKLDLLLGSWIAILATTQQPLRRLLPGSSSNTQNQSQGNQGGTTSQQVGLMLSPGNMICRPCPRRSSIESCVKWVGVGWAQRGWFGIWETTGRPTSKTQSIYITAMQLGFALWGRLSIPTCEMCRFLLCTFQDSQVMSALWVPEESGKNIRCQGFSTHLAAPELVTWGGDWEKCNGCGLELQCISVLFGKCSYVVITCDIHVITSSDWDWTPRPFPLVEPRRDHSVQTVLSPLHRCPRRADLCWTSSPTATWRICSNETALTWSMLLKILHFKKFPIVPNTFPDLSFTRLKSKVSWARAWQRCIGVQLLMSPFYPIRTQIQAGTTLPNPATKVSWVWIVIPSWCRCSCPTRAYFSGAQRESWAPKQGVNPRYPKCSKGSYFLCNVQELGGLELVPYAFTVHLLWSNIICNQVGHQIGKDRDSRILCRLRMDLLGCQAGWSWRAKQWGEAPGRKKNSWGRRTSWIPCGRSCWIAARRTIDQVNPIDPQDGMGGAGTLIVSKLRKTKDGCAWSPVPPTCCIIRVWGCMRYLFDPQTSPCTVESTSTASGRPKDETRYPCTVAPAKLARILSTKMKSKYRPVWTVMDSDGQWEQWLSGDSGCSGTSGSSRDQPLHAPHATQAQGTGTVKSTFLDRLTHGGGAPWQTCPWHF